MTTFWIAAGTLAAVAVALVLIPLWRERRRGGRWSWIGVAVALAIVPAAAVLYRHVSQYDHAVAERAAEGIRLVQRLAERMQENPEDVRGWRLLGQAYMSLGQYSAARWAFTEAWQRTPSPDNELKVAYAEANVLTDRSALTGEAARIFEEVLASEPSNPKALYYSGMAAFELGRSDVAAERWSRMLRLDLPDEIRSIVERQLAAVGGPPRSPPSGAGGEGAVAAGPTLRLRVSLGDAAAAQQFGPNAALFLFARAPEGGPPVAVRREAVSAVPGEFTLGDANSMLPGRSLASFDEVLVVARVSNSGQATEQPGDWYGQAVVDPKRGEVVDLVIDRVVQ